MRVDKADTDLRDVGTVFQACTATYVQQGSSGAVAWALHLFEFSHENVRHTVHRMGPVTMPHSHPKLERWYLNYLARGEDFSKRHGPLEIYHPISPLLPSSDITTIVISPR
jgi:hypothetical protein